ncbi:mucin-17-like isoform X1 [Pieris brassicae]|uniref:mucin-17-like isoform X1 n=1 Tax=Pieris brassicae TaxID=7116 RepID=UPI001E661155|nr:mucin-17-like isoform X1 [Pieris brassicae]
MSDNSGVENDFRKADVSKKRNSIKKKVQNFSSEHDDAALVPLLQTNKDKPERNAPSAKFTLPKTKTDSLSEKDIQSVDVEKGSLSKPLYDNAIVVCNPAVVQNHMNTNVFGDMITSEVPKSSVLIEISEKKSTGFGTPLIFTTAKIHTDSKTKTAEPLHVTPVPILSTIEGNLVKSEVTYEKTNILPGKNEPTGKAFEKGKDVHSQIINKDDASGINQSKSSSNKFADQVKTSVAQPSQSNIATKSDTTKVSTVTTNRTDTTENSNVNSTVLSNKSKPDSTSSMKKLQRQKHTEETNISQNDLVIKKDSDMVKIDIKTNGTTRSDVKRFSAIHSVKSPSEQKKSIPTVKSITNTEGKEMEKLPMASKEDVTTNTEKPLTQKITTTVAKEIPKSPFVSSITSTVKPTLAQKTITSSPESKEATKSFAMSSKGETASSVATFENTSTQKSITSTNTGTELKMSSKVEASSFATQPGVTLTHKTITPIDTGAKGKDAKSFVSPKVEATTITTKPSTSSQKTTPTASEPKDKTLMSSKIDAASIVKPATASPTINTIKTEVKDATKIPVSSKHEVPTVKTGSSSTERAITTLKQEPKTSVKPISTQKMATTSTEAKSAIPTAKPEVIKPAQKTLQITTEPKVASTKIPSKSEVLSSVYKPTMAQKTTPGNTGTQDKETTKSLAMSSKLDTASIATKPGATSTQKAPSNTATEATKSPISKHEIVKPTQKVPTKGKELPTSIKTPKTLAKSDKLKSPTQMPSQSQVPGANKPRTASEVAGNAKTKVPSYIVATSKTKIGTPNKLEDSSAATTSVRQDSKDGKSDTKNAPKS